jgi:hypothetical protein
MVTLAPLWAAGQCVRPKKEGGPHWSLPVNFPAHMQKLFEKLKTPYSSVARGKWTTQWRAE